ncbi:MAG: hypothetical protein CVU44_07765 [Chloroflexi bacterium HGW-Chloroflexi-6]|nr:MAG: hypothetical protein CVU44_07765 [Chloroflexi bacterium HGW-Chloroflexi-6]
MKKILLPCLLLMLVLAACAPAELATATSEPATPQASETPSPEPSSTSTPLPTETETPPPSSTPLPSETPSPEPTPTYAILRGTVNVEKVSCRYGPGAMYLYLYGMVQGANQDVIGRNEQGTWALTMSRGDNKSCWVKTDLMDLNGEIMSVQPIDPDDYNLPKSPFYGPLTNVGAKRNGNEVVVSWNPLILRAGDDSLQTPYVLQVWVCRAGEIVMESLGAYETSISVVDEPGCAEPSHGRITSAEKHGYTKFVEIPWP